MKEFVATYLSADGQCPIKEDWLTCQLEKFQDDGARADFEAMVAQLNKEVLYSRMSIPISIHDADLSKIFIARRFGVEQGAKDRPIDDETANGVNAAC